MNTVNFESIVFYDTFNLISQFCGNDIKSIDVCSKKLCYGEYRHYLLKYYILKMLKLSDIPSDTYHYHKIKDTLTDFKLIDYFLYIMSTIKTLTDMLVNYTNSDIWCIFKNSNNFRSGINSYQFDTVRKYIVSYSNHVSKLLSNRKIVLLNMYSKLYPESFNRQYNCNCLLQISYYDSKPSSCLLYIIHKLIPNQCITNQYIKKILFNDIEIMEEAFSHLPQNNLYLTLIENSYTNLNLIYKKQYLFYYFKKFKRCIN